MGGLKIGYDAKRLFHNHSGLGNYSRNLIRSLDDFHPENEYVLFNPSSAKIPFTGTHTKEIKPLLTTAFYKNMWRQRLVTDQAAKQGVDIYHGLSQELPLGLRKKKIKSIVTVHDLIFLRYPQRYKMLDRKIYLQKVKSACKRADLIVAISEQTRSDLIDLLKISPSRITVIYQGADPLFWEDHSVQFEAVRQKYHIPDEFLLFVGTKEKRKRPEMVLQAAQELNIPLVMIGKATKHWKKHLKNIPNQTGLFEPYVESTKDLATIYQMAKIFTYPSIFEGFGIPVLEALISKTPVITSNVSCLPEVAGPLSKLVDPLNEKLYTETLEHLWQQESEQKQMADEGYKFAQHFTDEHLAGLWNTIYHEIAAK